MTPLRFIKLLDRLQLSTDEAAEVFAVKRRTIFHWSAKGVPKGPPSLLAHALGGGELTVDQVRALPRSYR